MLNALGTKKPLPGKIWAGSILKVCLYVFDQEQNINKFNFITNLEGRPTIAGAE